MKIGIIGNYGHQSFVVDSLKLDKNLKLVAMAKGCDSDDLSHFMDHLKSLGYQPKLYDDYVEMLEKESLDVVSTGPQFGLNGLINIEVAKRGIPLFAEKPIATDLKSLDELEAVYNAKPFPLVPMLNFRYSPAFYTAGQLIDSGAIGKVCLINAQKSYCLGQRPDFYKSRVSYGGTIPWVGSHAIDWVSWYSKSKFKNVWAAHSCKENKGHAELESYALCQFQLENDIIAAVNLDYLRPAKARSHGDDRVRVAGSEGVIEVRESKCFLINDSHQGEVDLQAPSRGLFLDFLEEIKGNGKCLLSAQDAFIVTRVSLLARQSADTNQVMEF